MMQKLPNLFAPFYSEKLKVKSEKFFTMIVNSEIFSYILESFTFSF